MSVDVVPLYYFTVSNQYWGIALNGIGTVGEFLLFGLIIVRVDGAHYLDLVLFTFYCI